MKGTTASGFAFEVADTVLDNMELLDALADASENDPLAVSRVVRMVLGDAQRKQLYDHLRAEDGRVPVASVNQELVDIINAFGSDGKNS